MQQRLYPVNFSGECKSWWAPHLPNLLSEQEKIAAEALKREKLLEQSKEADNLIMDLFGGKEKFEELPELDGKDRGQFIRVKQNELTAPIMRGKTSDNRLFFTIRYKDAENNIMHETFFSRYADKGFWISTGDIVIGELIHCNENYKSEEQPGYYRLKNFIKSKKLQIEWGYEYELRTYELC